MNEKKHFIDKKVKNLEESLEEIKQRGNLSGVLLVSREGNILSNNFEEEIDTTIFSAMCASVLESAETLRNILAEVKPPKIITELDDRSIMLIRCSSTLFLVLFIDDNSNIDPILDTIDDYIHKIILISST
ncbi:MAG: roadblock/LC7 domain-containing protein [Candidatus Lokiarchaeota archaeon]|nr:roadblock/LC7 domain-containing protein [Candidatus Lokiarchaeota archaeon]